MTAAWAGYLLGVATTTGGYLFISWYIGTKKDKIKQERLFDNCIDSVIEKDFKTAKDYYNTINRHSKLRWFLNGLMIGARIEEPKVLERLKENKYGTTTTNNDK